MLNSFLRVFSKGPERPKTTAAAPSIRACKPLDKSGTNRGERGRAHRSVTLATALIFFPAWPGGAVPPLPEIVIPTPPPPQIFLDWTLDPGITPRIWTAVLSKAAAPTEVLRLTLRASGQKTWDLSITTPLPLYLPDAVSLVPETAEPISVPWFTCAPAGCEARVAMTAELLRDLRRGHFANIELSLVDRTHARIPVSLRGFTAASRKLGIRIAP